jgi:Ser/Thr protein kinase RdoA (MazF antagonist)
MATNFSGQDSSAPQVDRLKTSFFSLTPDTVLNALESHGHWVTGRYRMMNSYENRVFDIDLEAGDSVIVKFYRPNRWSQQCILEEHSFLRELSEEGIPVASPIVLSNNSTLAEHSGMWMAVFPKIRGRLIEEILPHQVPTLARWLARIHNVGARKAAKHRPTLKPNLARLQLLEPHVPIELWRPYREVAEEIFDFLDSALPHFQPIRVHGDFHRGNLIWNQEWTLIDFDDFLMAPAAQDFWIILTQLSEDEQETFVRSYRELREWSDEEFFLLEPLRAYRIIHYSTWIAERWDDPSFPHLFPGFHDFNFWSNELLSLQKIVARPEL